MNKLMILPLLLIALNSHSQGGESTPKDANGNGMDVSEGSRETQASTIAPGISCVACGRFEQGPNLMDANTAFRPGDSASKDNSGSSEKSKTGK